MRRWITHEANGIESHPDLRLASDADLRTLLTRASSAAAGGLDGAPTGMAETRARIILEVSRTSRFAMLDASTTQIYSRATAPLEPLVVEWLSAMRENVDLALSTPALGAPTTPYAGPTSTGVQPWLDTRELTGVVGALALDTGTGLHAKEPGAAYDRLVEHELDETRRSVQAGSDVRHDVVRLGFFDQSASAALVDVARRQDTLNRSALQGAAEAGHVIEMIMRGGLAGLVSTVHAYVQDGTTRTALDDLVVSLVRSDVELDQTERNDARRAELVSRIAAITGGRDAVLPAMALGAARGPALPTAEALRTARTAEIRAAAEAARQEAAAGTGPSAFDRLTDRLGPGDRVHVVNGSEPSLPVKAGTVDTTLVQGLEAHEKSTGARLAALGHHVQFLPASGDGKSADALVDGVLWEFKSPTGVSSETIVRNLRKGSEQSPRVVIDLARCGITIEEAVRQAEYALARYERLEAIIIIDKAGRTIERTR